MLRLQLPALMCQTCGTQVLLHTADGVPTDYTYRVLGTDHLICMWCAGGHRGALVPEDLVPIRPHDAVYLKTTPYPPLSESDLIDLLVRLGARRDPGEPR